MRLIRISLAVLLIPLATGTAATMDKGTIFTASTVLAGPSQKPMHDAAVFVSGGLIREVGPAADVRRAHPGAHVVDAAGTTILPGLTDAHAHLYGLGFSLEEVDLVGTTSYEEVIARVKQRAAATAANEWVMGRGWDQTAWPVKEFPAAGPLDAAVPGKPVYLTRVDGHAGLANSVAMKLAGVSAATPDPHGGRIIRDANGNPTGVFVDAAQDLIERVIPAPTHEQVKRRVLAAAENIASYGLVEIHDAGEGPDVIRAVRELIDEHKLPIRLYLMISDN